MGRDPDPARFIERLPKAENHLHIEGACPYEILKEIDPKKYGATPPFWDKDYRFKDGLKGFMEVYLDYCRDFFTSAERYGRAAEIMFRNCAAQGCRYVETSFHLPNLLAIKESGPEVIRAIHSAAPPGLDIRVFAGMSHNDYQGAGRELIEDSLNWPELDGLDLHGWEDIPLEDWTADVWERARRRGKYTKAHAGEFMGPEFVEQVMDRIKPQRIQHGIRSIENPSTVKRLAAEGMALDICLWSNVKLGAPGAEVIALHPIRRLFDAGVTVTVSSDDPFFLGSCLLDEYRALHEHLAFTLYEIVAIAANGFKNALLPEEVRNARLAEVASFAAENLLPDQ